MKNNNNNDSHFSLSDESIAKYQRIYKEKYGEDISKQEAFEQGLALINFMKASMKKPYN